MQYKLNVEKREDKTNLKALRKSGKIPAVMYGPKEKSVSISVPEKDFVKIFKKAGESSVVELIYGKDTHESLIHDVSYDPVKSNPVHIDFYIIEKGKKVKVHIPLTFDGVAPGVKEKGGILVKVMHQIEIEAAPKDLPHEVKVDLSSLVDIDSHISAKDIKLPSGVLLVTQGDDIVVSVALPKEEKEEAPTEIDMSAIEVEKKGKEVKEGEEVTEAGEAPKEKGKDKDKEKGKDSK